MKTIEPLSKKERKEIIRLLSKPRIKVGRALSLAELALENLSSHPDLLDIEKFLGIFQAGLGFKQTQSLVFINRGEEVLKILLIKSEEDGKQEISLLPNNGWSEYFKDDKKKGLLNIREELEKDYGLIRLLLVVDINSYTRVVNEMNREKILHPLLVIVKEIQDMIEDEGIIIHPLPEPLPMILNLDLESIYLKFMPLFKGKEKSGRFNFFKICWYIVILILRGRGRLIKAAQFALKMSK